MFLSKKSLNRSIQSAVRLDVYAEMCLQSFTDPCERHTFAEHKKHSCPVNPHHYSYFENMGATTLRILTLCQEHVCHLLSIKHKLIVRFGITIQFWWSSSQIKKSKNQLPCSAYCTWVEKIYEVTKNFIISKMSCSCTGYFLCKERKLMETILKANVSQKILNWHSPKL